MSATVTLCAVNETLTPGTFARDFPAGSHTCDVTVDEQIGAKLAEESAIPNLKRDATRDAIVAAWTRQQSRIRSYRIAWEQEWIRPYREVPDLRPEKDRAANKEAKKAVIQPQFQNFKSRNRHWLDKDRFAVEQLLIEPKPAPITRTLRRAFDGKNGRQLLTVDFAEKAICHIERGFPDYFAQGADLRPGLLALRQIGPRLGRIDPAHCRVLPYRGKIDGVSCTILMANEPGSDQVFYWLDPDRNYIVLREHRMSDGRDYSHTEISYRSDPQLGWIPTGWKEAVVDERGGFDDLVTSKVTELVVNEPLPESTFRIDFPKGAEMN